MLNHIHETIIKKPQSHFLFVLLVGASVLTFFVFQPFSQTLILALVFAVIFHPFYHKILEKLNNQHVMAAFITTSVVVFIVLTPLIFFSIKIIQEAQQLYSYFVSDTSVFVFLNKYIQEFYLLLNIPGGFSIDFTQYLRQAMDWFLQNLGTVFSNSAKLFINSFIFIIALYYLFKDGSKLRKKIVALSPLPDTDDEIIFEKLKNAINSVVKGSLTVAFIQGILTTIGFIIFGVPNAVFWGTIAMAFALIPGIGTALIFIPATLFIFFTSGLYYGLGLLAWGVIAVGLVDNILASELISREIKLHPGIVFLSAFGGIMFFGPIGFLLGPLTVSLLFSILDIYSSILHHPEARLE
jgi:predicted PurR-regulated permease PerM